MMQFVIIALCFFAIYFARTERASAFAGDQYLSDGHYYFELEQRTGSLADEIITSAVILYSLDGQPDFLKLAFYPVGYAIHCRLTGEPMQVSLDGVSKFNNVIGIPVYAGPGRYFSKNASNNLTNLLTGEIVNILNREEAATNIRNAFIDDSAYMRIEQMQRAIELEQIRLQVVNESSVVSPMGGKGPGALIRPTGRRFAYPAQYITNADFFIRNPNHGHNNSNTHPDIPGIGACGVVAAQMILSYHNYFTDRRIIPAHGNGVAFLGANYGNLNFWPTFQIENLRANTWCTGLGTVDLICPIENQEILCTFTGTSAAFFLNLLHRATLGLQDLTAIQRRMNRFLDEHYRDANGNSLSDNARVRVTTVGQFALTRSRARAEINADRPIILGMEPLSGFSYHIVVAFGHHYIDGTEGFIVNFGWRRSNHHVWTNAGWYGSNIRMEVNNITHNFVRTGETVVNNNITWDVLECMITGVRRPTLAPQGITTPANSQVQVGSTVAITVTSQPAGIPIGTVSASSSNSSIANITGINGNRVTIRGISPGTAYITFSYRGFTTTTRVTVRANSSPPVFCICNPWSPPLVCCCEQHGRPCLAFAFPIFGFVDECCCGKINITIVNGCC